MEPQVRGRYEDFAVKLHPVGGSGEELEARVLSSAYGVHDRRFRWPFADDELPLLLADLDRGAGGGGEHGRRQFELADRHRPSAPELGKRLFDAVFQGSVRDGFLQSRAHAARSGTGGLRLRLVFDPTAAGAHRLLGLPWEFLYRSETRQFLALDPAAPLVRYLEVPQRRVALPPLSRLRILVAVAAPADLPRLDAETECERLRDAWSDVAAADVDLLPRATLGGLRQRLRTSAHHVVHFVGHGGFDDETGEGTLLFEDEAREAAPAPAWVVASTLAGQPDLRLVCLNACDTARVPRREGLDPFSGVAAALLVAGLPAVLAMQRPISDLAAIAFSQAFYAALATGDPVDAATVEGRLAVQRLAPCCWEWATPALYLGTPDGRLFAPETACPPAPDDPRPKPTRSVMKNHGDNWGIWNSGRIEARDVTIHQARKPEEEARNALEAGAACMERRQYQRARELLARAGDTAELPPAVAADLLYHLSLAQLAGRRPRTLGFGEAAEIVGRLDEARGYGAAPAHLLLFLALLKQDCFESQGLRVPPPAPVELLREAVKARVEPPRLRQLSQHLPALDNPIAHAIRGFEGLST